MQKLLLIPILLMLSCLIGALYGAIHNQISYTVSPEYFLSFKLHQFGLPEHLIHRGGAALVGALSSWWMGLIIGVPICFIGLRPKNASHLATAFSKSASVAVGVTLLLGTVTLTASFFTMTPDNIPVSAMRPNVQDALAFARAGAMHDFGYLGGLVGMAAGCVLMWRECSGRD